MQPLNDQRFTKNSLLELVQQNNTREYSYLAGHLMEMISWVQPNSADENVLKEYLINYFFHKTNWEIKEQKTTLRNIDVTIYLKDVQDFCRKWGLIPSCTQGVWTIGGNITRPEDE
jgi:hypothetical protein